MKKNLFLFLALLGSTVTFGQSFHGEKIDDTNAISTMQLAQLMTKADTLVTKVEGQVESVCKMKGCWMKVKMADGQTMRVTFKDYGFFVPKDIANKKVVFEGVAKIKTTTVGELKHFAEDAGKSKEEIAKITKPETSLTFVADGVIVKQ